MVGSSCSASAVEGLSIMTPRHGSSPQTRQSRYRYSPSITAPHFTALYNRRSSLASGSIPLWSLSLLPSSARSPLLCDCTGRGLLLGQFFSGSFFQQMNQSVLL